MARKGLRKVTARKSLRPRTPRPAVSGPVPVQRNTRSTPSRPGPASGSAPHAAAARGTDPLAIPRAAPIPRELRAAQAEPAPHEQLHDAFFESEPRYSEHDELMLPVMPTHARRAMFAALTIFAVFLALILAHWAYQSWIMPSPVELGTRAPVVPSEPPASVWPAPVFAPASAPSAPDPLPQAAGVATPLAPPVAAAAPAAPGVVPPSYEELLAAGEALWRGGRASDALSAFSHALALRPDGSAALAHAANAYLVRGDSQRAKDFASRALLADPTSSEAWIVLGAALEALGDRAAALGAYRKCAALGVGAYLEECRSLLR
jgi:tetratricopeptide (TPR) repeat protein